MVATAFCSSEPVDPSSKHCCAGEPQSTKLVQTVLFAALPFVRPQPGICLGAVVTTAARQLHSVGQLLEDQIDTLRAQRDEALELASRLLHVRLAQPQHTTLCKWLVGCQRHAFD